MRRLLNDKFFDYSPSDGKSCTVKDILKEIAG